MVLGYVTDPDVSAAERTQANVVPERAPLEELIEEEGRTTELHCSDACQAAFRQLVGAESAPAKYLMEEGLTAVGCIGDKGSVLNISVLDTIENLPTEALEKLRKSSARMRIFMGGRDNVDAGTYKIEKDGLGQLHNMVGELWECTQKGYDNNRKTISSLLDNFTNEEFLLEKLEGARSLEGDMERIKYIITSAHRLRDMIEQSEIAPEIIQTQIYNMESALMQDGFRAAIEQTAIFDDMAKITLLCIQYAVYDARGDEQGKNRQMQLIDEALESQGAIYRHSPLGLDENGNERPMHSQSISLKLQHTKLDGEASQREMRELTEKTVADLIALHRENPDIGFCAPLAKAAIASLPTEAKEQSAGSRSIWSTFIAYVMQLIVFVLDNFSFLRKKSDMQDAEHTQTEAGEKSTVSEVASFAQGASQEQCDITSNGPSATLQDISVHELPHSSLEQSKTV